MANTVGKPMHHKTSASAHGIIQTASYRLQGINMKNFLIAPSILSANFAKLGEDVDAVLTAGADVVHFDVMDNHYVPNLSFGPMICEALRKHGVTAPIDVHLMVSPVDDLIEKFADAGASYISFHPEASQHIDRSLQLIIDKGCEPGLVFNPATPLHYLDHVIDKLHHILIMSVNPGFGGQKFIPSMLDKIRNLSEVMTHYENPIELEVDGGINHENVGEIKQAGASVLVAGSAVFKAKDYKKAIKALREG